MRYVAAVLVASVVGYAYLAAMVALMTLGLLGMLLALAVTFILGALGMAVLTARHEANERRHFLRTYRGY